MNLRLVRQQPNGKLLEIVRDFSMGWGTARPSLHTKASYLPDFQKLAIQFLMDQSCWNLAYLLTLNVLFHVIRQFHPIR